VLPCRQRQRSARGGGRARSDPARCQPHAAVRCWTACRQRTPLAQADELLPCAAHGKMRTVRSPAANTSGKPGAARSAADDSSETAIIGSTAGTASPAKRPARRRQHQHKSRRRQPRRGAPPRASRRPAPAWRPDGRAGEGVQQAAEQRVVLMRAVHARYGQRQRGNSRAAPVSRLITLSFIASYLLARDWITIGSAITQTMGWCTVTSLVPSERWLRPGCRNHLGNASITSARVRKVRPRS